MREADQSGVDIRLAESTARQDLDAIVPKAAMVGCRIQDEGQGRSPIVNIRGAEIGGVQHHRVTLVNHRRQIAAHDRRIVDRVDRQVHRKRPACRRRPAVIAQADAETVERRLRAIMHEADQSGVDIRLAESTARQDLDAIVPKAAMVGCRIQDEGQGRSPIVNIRGAEIGGVQHHRVALVNHRRQIAAHDRRIVDIVDRQA